VDEADVCLSGGWGSVATSSGSVHSEGNNYLFADGHSKWQKWQQTRSGMYGLAPTDRVMDHANSVAADYTIYLQ
jgi:prepilin-type processing-associated H-X9-DG protein